MSWLPTIATSNTNRPNCRFLRNCFCKVTWNGAPMNHRLIRFDVRLDQRDYVNALWDREHRNCFLLKPEVEWPLSIDPRVWPSVLLFPGFDIADLSGISALSNCEYSPQEKERLARFWEARLNAFGLLATDDDAKEFRQLSNSRVPEHSPFWVFGIWRVPFCFEAG